MAAGDGPTNESGQTATDGDEASRPASSAVPAAEWERLGWDLTELILCRLPLRSLVRAAAVCRQWRAVVSRCPPSFSSFSSSSSCSQRRRRRPPWLFLFAHQYSLVDPPRLGTAAFAYDPSDDDGDESTASWIPLPPSSAPLPGSFSGAGGFSFSFLSSSPSRLSLSPLLRPHATSLSPPLSFPRSNPLVVPLPGPDHTKNPIASGGGGGVVVVGGLLGGVDDPRLVPVEIYEGGDDEAWALGPPLPAEFRPGCSSQWLSAALLPGRGLLFVLATYSGLLAAFDLARRAWTRPRPLRPRAPPEAPPPLFAFLATAGARGRLVLAGLRSGPGHGPAQLAIWAVDDAAAECEEVGAMPRELLAWLFRGDEEEEEEEERLARLKCAGGDGVVYVFNEVDRRRGFFAACVCEISDDDDAPGGLTCAWRKVPPLPKPVDPFHKVLAFCSPVPLHPVLAPLSHGSDVEIE